MSLLNSVRGSIISSYSENYFFSAENPMNLNARNFKLAFGLNGIYDAEFKNDPRYVSYIVRLFINKDGKE